MLIHYWKVTYGISIDIEIGDLEWPWTAYSCRYFVPFHPTR